MINVTKTYLPDKDRYKQYVDRIFDSGWLTNRGSLLLELEERLREYLDVKHLILVANGSLALQVAYKALDLTGEVITTPFSFAATTSTLAWEGLKPVFADIDPDTFNMDPLYIEPLITPKTSAIVPVHVFGNPCDVESIAAIAKKNGLKVIYDGAHAFGVKCKGRSILEYGDISTLSFHATKLFHTIEGGAVITNDDEVARKVRLLINFGITGPDKIEGLGTNSKMNEFEAAMGLCILDDMDKIHASREKIWGKYKESLKNSVKLQKINSHTRENYSYAPVLFNTENELLQIQSELNTKKIFPRRYFYPSLDTLEYISPPQHCRTSRSISERILCLPLFPDLSNDDQMKIINIILSNTKKELDHSSVIEQNQNSNNRNSIKNSFGVLDPSPTLV